MAISKCKDRVTFVTKEDHDQPMQANLPEMDMEEIYYEGRVLANGDINSNCSCLGNLPVGPCGDAFKKLDRCLDNAFMSGGPMSVMTHCVEQVRTWKACTDEYKDFYFPEKKGDLSQEATSSKGDNLEHDHARETEMDLISSAVNKDKEAERSEQEQELAEPTSLESS